MLLLRRSLINACEDAFFQYLSVALSCFHHLINKPPLRQSAYVTVVNKHVCLYLSAEMIIVVRSVLFGIILVDSIKLNTPFATPFYGIIKKFALADRP